MTKHTDPEDPKSRSPHSLSWIAMVVMAGMCLVVLIWATSLNVG